MTCNNIEKNLNHKLNEESNYVYKWRCVWVIVEEANFQVEGAPFVDCARRTLDGCNPLVQIIVIFQPGTEIQSELINNYKESLKEKYYLQ